MTNFVFTSKPAPKPSNLTPLQYWLSVVGVVLAILTPVYIYTVQPGYLKPIVLQSSDISAQVSRIIQEEYRFDTPDSIHCPTVTIWGPRKFDCEFLINDIHYRVNIHVFNKSGNITVDEPYII